MTTIHPEISLIVPLLNETAELTGLFASLATQDGICFEVILCDGGSTDDSPEQCHRLEGCYGLNTQLICTPRGRGAQMNGGAALARGDLLLFLHADSRFSGTDALRNAVDAYRKMAADSTIPIAARFRLQFRRQNARPSLAYFFYEAKARLNRADCIRGDQGFLLNRTLFNSLGGFDTSLPFLEDVRLAVVVAERARWELLPAIISTSARRFETEGLYERQVTNAIITNAIAADWPELFTVLPGIYRCSSESGRLELFPLLNGISGLLTAESSAWRRSFWRATGRHVAGNIWQLIFWLDVRSAFISGRNPDNVPALRLRLFQRTAERFTRGILIEYVTAAAVWLWLRVMLIRLGRSTETS